MTPELKFVNRYVEPILKDKKRTTWRLDLSINIEPHELVGLIDEDEEVFADAKIKWIKKVPIKYMEPEDFKWHPDAHEWNPGAPNKTQVIIRLGEFYPDRKVTGSTVINVIRFKPVKKYEKRK